MVEELLFRTWGCFSQACFYKDKLIFSFSHFFFLNGHYVIIAVSMFKNPSKKIRERKKVAKVLEQTVVTHVSPRVLLVLSHSSDSGVRCTGSPWDEVNFS